MRENHGRTAFGRVGAATNRSRGVRRVVPLTLGWCEVPYSMSVAGAPGDARLREPVPALLLETADGWVLVDTGFNPAFVRDPALRRRFHTSTGVEVWLPGDPSPDGSGGADEDPLLVELARVGLTVGDLAAVVITHLHNDHAGGLRHLAGTGVPIHVQRAELEYGLHAPPPGPEHDGIIRVDFDDPTLTWRLADDDVPIAPGVTALRTAGHTPGH
ncbi:MAG: MBL fold metallo-hydrolase, partial [Frankia sp.]